MKLNARSKRRENLEGIRNKIALEEEKIASILNSREEERDEGNKLREIEKLCVELNRNSKEIKQKFDESLTALAECSDRVQHYYEIFSNDLTCIDTKIRGEYSSMPKS
jgi:hypothetical protein